MRGWPSSYGSRLQSDYSGVQVPLRALNMTYIITQEEIKKVLTIDDAIKAVEKAFGEYALGNAQMPPKSYLSFPKGDLRSMPAYLAYNNIAGIKSVNVHPFNKKLPTVMAIILLVDPSNGYPLAVLDGTYITNMRTGAAGAVAAKYLSRKDAKVAGFIGTGKQARTQLAGLLEVRLLKEIKAYDINKEKLAAFCEEASKKYSIQSRATSIEEATNSDIVVTTTPVREPIVKADWIKEGCHINAIGADAAGKQELESSILKKAKIVIDNWEQASHSGEINVAFSQGGIINKGIIKKEDIYAELGEIVAGKKPGRQNDKEITIFDSTGLAIQDISTAFFVYNKLDKAKLLNVNFF